MDAARWPRPTFWWFTLALTEAARTWLGEKGYDPDFGARPLDRVVQTELEDRLADEVLFGDLAKGSAITVDREGDRLVFRPGA